MAEVVAVVVSARAEAGAKTKAVISILSWTSVPSLAAVS
jgi:hypothetical protein